MEMNKVFKDGLWSKEINVSDFVYTNITPYEMCIRDSTNTLSCKVKSCFSSIYF